MSDNVDSDFEVNDNYNDEKEDFLSETPQLSDTNLEEKLQCPFCEKKFKRRDCLRRHNLSIHQGIRPFQCEL